MEMLAKDYVFIEEIYKKYRKLIEKDSLKEAQIRDNDLLLWMEEPDEGKGEGK